MNVPGGRAAAEVEDALLVLLFAASSPNHSLFAFRCFLMDVLRGPAPTAGLGERGFDLGRPRHLLGEQLQHKPVR
jgi:hypothetical protein